MAYNNFQNNGEQRPYYNDTNTSYDRELPRLPSYRHEPGQPIVPQPSSSPFVGPFDDHVHPARDHVYQNPSNTSLGENSTYYGQGGGGRPQDSSNDFRDGIPLRDHTKNPDATDHVYDIEGSPEGKKRGIGFGRFRLGGGGERTAWVVWFLTTVQVAVFIAELVKAAQLTGIPIQIKPQFNPMIGPSPYVLINMGSRYGPCMHDLDVVKAETLPLSWSCPNSTSTDTTLPENRCRLSEVCGFNAYVNHTLVDALAANPSLQLTPEQVQIVNSSPNQWFRFITPMFLHVGVVHICFNMLLQVTIGREMEKTIGHIRFFVVYIAAGIFGFVLGGNFAGTGVSSAGASGALFGVIALTLLDLLYTWSERKSPGKDLGFIVLDIVISFVLGLLPGLDNFAHIGGFLMGLVLGICVLHSPPRLRRTIGDYEPPYQSVNAGRGKSGAIRFVKEPIAFFKGRKVAWWVWWVIRAVALVLVLVLFIVLLNNFYKYEKTCSWCKYLSCLPVNGWCDNQDLEFKSFEISSRAVDSITNLWRKL